jgi:hypothetical protein
MARASAHAVQARRGFGPAYGNRPVLMRCKKNTHVFAAMPHDRAMPHNTARRLSANASGSHDRVRKPPSGRLRISYFQFGETTAESRVESRESRVESRESRRFPLPTAMYYYTHQGRMQENFRWKAMIFSEPVPVLCNCKTTRVCDGTAAELRNRIHATGERS